MTLQNNKNLTIKLLIAFFVLQSIFFIILQLQIFNLNRKLFNNNKLIIEKLINTPTEELKIEIDTNDIIIGDHKAPLTLFMFSNYNCTICRSFFNETFPEFDKMFIKSGKVKFVLKLLVPVKPAKAEYISKAALFAYKQNKFIEFHNIINQSETQPDSVKVLSIFKQLNMDQTTLAQSMENPAIDKYFKKNKDYFKNHKLRGTPAFMLNENIIYGKKSIQEFEQIINDELGK
jgi:protein-disulfide isomerase